MQVIFKKYSLRLQKIFFAPLSSSNPRFFRSFPQIFLACLETRPVLGSLTRQKSNIFFRFFLICRGTRRRRNPARRLWFRQICIPEIHFPGSGLPGAAWEYLLITLSFPHFPQTFPQELFPVLCGGRMHFRLT